MQSWIEFISINSVCLVLQIARWQKWSSRCWLFFFYLHQKLYTILYIALHQLLTGSLPLCIHLLSFDWLYIGFYSRFNTVNIDLQFIYHCWSHWGIKPPLDDTVWNHGSKLIMQKIQILSTKTRWMTLHPELES